MKTILVDAIHAFVTEEGINSEMLEMLESFPNPKVLTTGADEEMQKKFGLDKAPYEVFSLKSNPPKSDPEYFNILLKHLGLTGEDVVYFEHNVGAMKSAESVGIKTYYYDPVAKDVKALREFLKENLHGN